VDKPFASIEVKRLNGKDGKVGCFWNTIEISAKAGTHFVDTKGIVLFDHGEDEKTIEVKTIFRIFFLQNFRFFFETFQKKYVKQITKWLNNLTKGNS